MPTVGFSNHNHQTCISGAVGAARAQCDEAGLKLTPVRARVLEILLQEHRALGAYEILDKLRVEGLGSQPPIAYRALEFLVANGFVHRVERLNAFIACAHPTETHTPTFLICRICKNVAEAQSAPLRGQMGHLAKEIGFKVESAVVEAEGICPNCMETDA